MTDGDKKISPPFSTGSGGARFENQVQTCYVVLMLSDGICPILGRPIAKIKLQGRYAGYHTDDFIAFVEERNGSNKAKLLGQIKHRVSFTNGNQAFTEAISAAWRDFKNPEMFDPSCDVIALICGPLSAADTDHVRPIMEFARESDTSLEFFEKMGLGNFMSEEGRQKLQVFRDQIKIANEGVPVTDDELWRFLRRYHVLGYDFDVASGAARSLVESHIAQFDSGKVAFIWEGVSGAVASANQAAGTLTKGNVSRAIAEIFASPRAPAKSPDGLFEAAKPATPLSGDQGDAVMLLNLVGAYDDKVPGDVDAARKLVE